VITSFASNPPFEVVIKMFTFIDIWLVFTSIFYQIVPYLSQGSSSVFFKIFSTIINRHHSAIDPIGNTSYKLIDFDSRAWVNRLFSPLSWNKTKRGESTQQFMKLNRKVIAKSNWSILLFSELNQQYLQIQEKVNNFLPIPTHLILFQIKFRGLQCSAYAL
jgi:hypothetical protein